MPAINIINGTPTVNGRTIVNATDHDITLILNDRTRTVIPASGLLARIVERTTPDGNIQLLYPVGIPFNSDDGTTAYIVNRAIAYHRAANGHNDQHIYVVAELIRDATGNTIGGRKLVRITPTEDQQ